MLPKIPSPRGSSDSEEEDPKPFRMSALINQIPTADGPSKQTYGDYFFKRDFQQLMKKHYAVEQLFQFEENVPDELLNGVYEFLLVILTAQDSPKTDTNEAERSNILLVVLAKIVWYFVENPKFNLQVGDLKVNSQPYVSLIARNEKLAGRMDYSVSGVNSTSLRNVLVVECMKSNMIDGFYQCYAYLMKSKESAPEGKTLYGLLFEGRYWHLVTMKGDVTRVSCSCPLIVGDMNGKEATEETKRVWLDKGSQLVRILYSIIYRELTSNENTADELSSLKKTIPTLGYWDRRGNTEAIRLVLHHAGIDFVDKRYSEEEWERKKQNLGLPRVDLPYWIEGDLKLVDSTAILRHVAEKARLVGETLEEKAIIGMLEQWAISFREGLVGVCHSDDFEVSRGSYLSSLVAELTEWSNRLGENQYLLGDRLTYVDFLFYDALQIHCVLEPTILNGRTNLKDYVKRIEKLPNIAVYHKHGMYNELPYNSNDAKWGAERD